MPSRLGIVLIILFWLGTTSLLFYREVVPRYFSDGPPPFRIDLADEATQAVPAIWTITRNDKSIGTISTYMKYVEVDDTFWFHSDYRSLELNFQQMSIKLPVVDNSIRVSRAGELREQTLFGNLELHIGGIWIASAVIDLQAKVRDDQLVGTVKFDTSIVPAIVEDLEPVPVIKGQVLNPLMPVGRLQDVRPGRRWVIRETNPLQDSIAILVKQTAQQAKLPSTLIGNLGSSSTGRELIAEVRSRPENLVRKSLSADSAIDTMDSYPCWVIDYRAENFSATTWVHIKDGRVLRQEATGFGDTIRFEREL